MKICLSGPSGSGKTTLARYIHESLPELGLPRVDFISNSASDLISAEKKKALEEIYGYIPSGHKNVIRQGHINPDFGKEFQLAILNQRIKLYEDPNLSFIADRCPIDNLAYYLDQVVMYEDNPAATEEFIITCMKALAKADIIFLVKVCHTEVEDNGSRVANIFYQRKVDRVFQLALDLIVAYANKFGIGLPPIHTVSVWDWDKRTRLVDYALVNAFKKEG